MSGERLACVWGVCAALLCALGPGRAQDPEPDTKRVEDPAAVEREVRAFLEHYLRTLEQRDAAAVRELFVPDDRFAWYTDGRLAYSSAAEVLRGLASFGEMRASTVLSDVRVVPLSRVHASARSGFRTELSGAGADGVSYAGVLTWLLEREEPGEPWRVLLGHTSTPGGPPGGGGR